MRVRCGQCGELYDLYSSMGGQTFVCATCGSTLLMPQTDGKDVNDLKLCPNCKRLIDSSAIICEFCGELMLESDPVSEKHRRTYIILAVIFGTFGVHNFYAGYPKKAIVQCILSLTFILSIVTILWIVCDILFVSRDGNGRKME